MTRRLLRGSLVAAAPFVCSLVVLASSPGFWQAATQADFLRGEVDQLSIDEHGRLTLGPELQRVHDGGVPFVWALLPAADGSVFLGTGNDGKVIRVDRAGNGSIFYDSSELEVHALANAPNGQLYVGTSPDGRIYRVDAQGRAETFFDPEDKYIWAIAVDKQGVVFAATGDKGVVYRITPDGKSTKFFSTKAMHAVSLAFDPNGQLLVGTGSPGRVFRVDVSGKGFLLLDTTYQEIHSLRIDPKGLIYAAAQSGRQAPQAEDRTEAPPVPAAQQAVPTVSTEITSIAVIDVPVTPSSGQSGPPPRDDRRGPTGAVYRVQPDGLWDELWTSREDAPYDLAVEADGSVLIATGPKGKLFRLGGNPMRALLLTRVPSQQSTMLARVADRTLVATANPGLLMAISSTRALRGTYESEVKDAQTVATWGVLSWRASIPSGAQVQLFTRSGNTKTPDEAWSDWTGPYSNANGSAITSPKARYLQWRAVLTAKTDTPVLTSVSSAYLPRNVRPQVTSITVHPPGVVFQKPFSSGEAEIAGLDDDTPDRRSSSGGGSGLGLGGGPQLGRRTFQRGLQTFVWRAEDDNGDELTYDVMYRREGETTWRPLKSGLKETLFVWDTSSVPNGTYVLRVLASDAKANPAETALVGDMESNSFEIDTVAPVVTMGAVRRDGTRFVISGDVRDADSAVTRLEYSLDAQRWEPAFARDGILDGRAESFEIRLEAAASGRTLVVRASDALGNVGTGQVLVR
jgi:sugar lactone lactonase YvrE